MDVALLSMALNQGQVQQQASISILKTAMDQAEGNADFVNKMLEESDLRALQYAAQPHLGGTIDLKG
ncbi:YjfB family protein [Bacillus sp. CGMCC 1.16607]|uniref:YjfB family protein n=1 Tax=Bacillus sp. CGMCC 1.16607 TaxID=3351842 RepID=UPI00363F9CED